MIGKKYNYDDVFFRDLTVCLLDTLEGKIKWVNKFSNGDVEVKVPFYYSLTGDERFLLDSFNDDIVINNRYVDSNTDIIPRGHITLESVNIKSDEFTNPNVWLRMIIEDNKNIKSVLSKIRAIPINVNYDLKILLSNEIDVYKCIQSLLNTIYFYKYMYFEYNFMNIDALMLLPDQSQIDIKREKDLSTNNQITISFNLEIHTYYPAFNVDSEGINNIIIPHKTRWYSNILKMRKK